MSDMAQSKGVSKPRVGLAVVPTHLVIMGPNSFVGSNSEYI